MLSLRIPGRFAIVATVALAGVTAGQTPGHFTFVENAGQWDTPALFVARAQGRTVRVEERAIGLQVEHAGQGAYIRLSFENTQDSADVHPLERRPGSYNFFLGRDPEGWRTGLSGWAEAFYADLYPGIDLALHRRRGRLEYDFELAPGADLARVAIRCEGAESVSLSPEGALVIGTAAGQLVQSPPET